MKPLAKMSDRSRPPELEERLRESRQAGPVPADLHDSIITAVRGQALGSAAAARTLAEGYRPLWVKWVAVLSVATACAVVGFVLLRQDEGSKSQLPRATIAAAAPIQTSDLHEDLTGSLPSALSPLSEELTRVRTDLDRTADFLISSLP
jgi:hypothetical protein